MNLFYKKSFGIMLLSSAIVGTACGQKTKIKTITIVNGDTTVNEEIISDKDFAWNDKDGKKTVKMMKFISTDGDSSSMDEKMKIFIEEDGEGDKKTYNKKIIMMDDGGNVKTVETENGYTYEIEIDDTGKKEKRVSTEADAKAGEKHKIVKIHGPSGQANRPPLKNINIDVDAKTQVLKLDLSSESTETISVVVMDESGKQVFYDSQKQGDKYKKEIKLGKKGVYFLSIIQNKKVLNERIVVE